MATTRAPTRTWVARNGDIYMDWATNIDFVSSNTLSGSFGLSGIAFGAAVKNITITPPDASWEKQDLMGEDSNNFQNQVLDEKPVGIATVTATLIVGEDETIEDYVMSGVPLSAPSGYTRRQLGSATQDLAIAVTMITPDGANEVTHAMDNAKVTKWGDVRISGPDSHWEQDFTVICLAKDYYFEMKD